MQEYNKSEYKNPEGNFLRGFLCSGLLICRNAFCALCFFGNGDFLNCVELAANHGNTCFFHLYGRGRIRTAGSFHRLIHNFLHYLSQVHFIFQHIAIRINPERQGQAFHRLGKGCKLLLCDTHCRSGFCHAAFRKHLLQNIFFQCTFNFCCFGIIDFFCCGCGKIG